MVAGAGLEPAIACKLNKVGSLTGTELTSWLHYACFEEQVALPVCQPGHETIRLNLPPLSFCVNIGVINP